MLHSAAASCERSLMPSNRPSSSNATALTIRPSSRASRTRSVRYSSPRRRRRRQGPDPAPQPVRVEGVDARVRLVAGQLVGCRVPGLDDALDGPELAPDHPAELGRVGREHAGQRDRGVVLAARFEDGVEVGPGHERDVTGQDEDLDRIGRHDRQGGPHRVTGPARLVLEGEGRPIGEDVDHGRDRRGEDDDGVPAGRAVGGAGPGVEHVGQHRPAAQRVEDLGNRGLHPGAEAGRQHHGDRAARRIGTWGVHGERRRRPGLVERCSLATRAGPAANAEAVISGTGIVGAPPRGCQPSRATASISIRAPFGRAATPIVERAGGGSPMNRP